VKVLLIALLLWTCNDQGFQGGAGKVPPAAKDSTDGTPGGRKAGADGDDPSNSDDFDDKLKRGGDAGGDRSTDEPDGNGDDGNNDNDGQKKSIFDTINDIFKTFDNNDTFSQPDDETAIFGGKKVFHIGDDGFTNTSCRFEINTFDLQGVQYFFEIEVLEDGTELDININKICGIDYENISGVRLLRGSTEIKKVPLSTSTFDLNLSRGETFSAGKYVVVVESGRGDPKNPADFDNFVVGNIVIKSTNGKKIKVGRVGARRP
jgi:hypothetical protein